MNLISPVNITSKHHSVKSITLNMVHSRVDMVIKEFIIKLTKWFKHNRYKTCH